jgi:hypothetical protein
MNTAGHVVRFRSSPFRLLQLALGAALALVLCTACVRRGGPTDVAAGKLYEPGEPTYDEFFKSLYSIQLSMGTAPDREQGVRQRLAKVAEVPSSATDDDLSAGLTKRLDGWSKQGVAVKVSTSDLEGAEPGAKVVTTGTASAPADKESIDELDQAVKDGASLLVDLRHAKPELTKLSDEQASLEPKIDTAFKDSRSRKRAEIKQNFVDADKLLPMMTSRQQIIDGRLVALFHALEKTSPTAVAATPPPPEPAAAKKKDKKAAKASKAPALAMEKPPKPKKDKEFKPKLELGGAEPKPPKPKPAPEEAPKPKPAPEEAPKPKPKAPSEDFEP